MMTRAQHTSARWNTGSTCGWLCWPWYSARLKPAARSACQPGLIKTRGETMSFFSRLEARARSINSLLCVGLDPHTSDLSAPTAAAAKDFCLRLIEATHDLALAFKPNAAFFEAFGAEGWPVLQDVIAAVPQRIPVILDAKRGDIASTAEAYARSAFQVLKAHAITLNPYLGRDALDLSL